MRSKPSSGGLLGQNPDRALKYSKSESVSESNSQDSIRELLLDSEFLESSISESCSCKFFEVNMG